MSKVSSYAGFRYPERPRSFSWHGIQHVVEKVLSEWRTPEQHCFRVRCVNGACFELHYWLQDERWVVIPPGQ
ncbi:MAG: hypothetical protein Fur0018_05710 [Anaerolineales bacterium]